MHVYSYEEDTSEYDSYEEDEENDVDEDGEQYEESDDAVGEETE